MVANATSSPLVRSLLINVGWFILPNTVTNIVYTSYIRLRLKFHPRYQPPARGTPQAAMLYRHCYAFVMVTYLLVTTIHSFISMPLNFYDILGVDASVDDHALKVAFRQFARRNHPDRLGPSAEPLFIAVRDAYESLNDPLKRFAYDRFGPDAMTWKGCATHKEYIKHGLLASSGFYIGTIGFLILWSIFGVANTGAYWRNLFLCTLFFLELCLILNTGPGAYDSPESSFLLASWFRKRVPYQYTLFLHQLYMSLSIAIARVVPMLFPSSAQTSAEILAVAKSLIDKLALLTMTTDREVSRMLSLELRSMHGSLAVPPLTTDPFTLSSTPFIPSEETIQALIAEMESLIIDKELQNNPALRNQWLAVIKQLQQEATPAPDSATSNGSPFTAEPLTKEEEEKKIFDERIERVLAEPEPSLHPSAFH